jgi:hypothetical protein
MNTLAALSIFANYLPGLQITLWPRLVEIAYPGGHLVAHSLPAAVEALVTRVIAADPADHPTALIEALRALKTETEDGHQ